MRSAPTGERTRERLAAAALVALIHAALLWALLGHGAMPVVRREGPGLATFDVPPPPPPRRPVRHAARRAAPAPDGAAGRRAQRTAVTAPVPLVPPPVAPPIVAALLPDLGSAATSGTAAAGTGTGRGSGGSGSGGGGTRARLVSGAIGDADYPRAARRARIGGTATVRFTVGSDGRARDCRVADSAGDATLDAVTCRLVEARFRYAPARDAAGRPVAEARGWRQRWWIEP